jgi:methylthioribose-1-phosphate isomerase
VIARLTSVDDVIHAIRALAVRGAPAIGACGALGVVVGLDERRPREPSHARAALAELIEIIGSARPTAVNLRWAVERVGEAAAAGSTVEEIRKLALEEAGRVIDEDRASCTAIGEFGRIAMSGMDRILTHCNTGRLATTGWGTALGVIYAKVAAGEAVSVYASESRPLLQGARLTVWELMDAGIDVTLIPDGSDAALMASGAVDAVIVGADRIARNGDSANKVGTFSHAVNARYAGIPFYVAAPLSTFDPTIATGDEIEIEIRSSRELVQWRSEPTAPADAKTWNPAFDVTPGGLITALITDVGVIEPPYEETIPTALEQARR